MLKILLFILINYVRGTIEQECQLSLHRDITDISPLLLQPGNKQGVQAFYLPISHGIITIPSGTEFDIICNAGHIILSGENTQQHTIKITCLHEDIFSINNQNYMFKNITCAKENEKSVKDSGTCLGKNKLLKIGFQTENRFLDLISVCFDDQLKRPLHSSSHIQKNIEVVTCPRPFFEEGIQFLLPQNADDYYKFRMHQRSINSQLGLLQYDPRYVNGSIFITRGHLVAKADLMYPCHQLCTFYHINCAPQWNYMNNIHWNDLEIAIRELAHNREIHLTIVAGTSGVLKLANNNGKMVEIYLYNNKGVRALPVPEFFWKFVYDIESRNGVVLVASNSPNVGDMRMICEKNVCDMLTWITVDIRFIYCCRYKDFVNNFGNIPEFQVQDLLV